MAGTREGGIKAGKTNKAKYGSDYYKRIGSIGGKNGHTGGFASNPELAKIAGQKGGRMSHRGASRKKRQTVFIRPVGDGDSIVYKEDENGDEVEIETPAFEEYYEAEEWCYAHGYNPVWE